MKSVLAILAPVLLASGCAVVGHKPSGTGRVAVVHAATGPSGELEVAIVCVRRWLRIPWEIQRGQESPEAIYLSPGAYTIELNCHEGPIYLHYTPTFRVSVSAGSEYILGCRPQGRDENFYLAPVAP